MGTGKLAAIFVGFQMFRELLFASEQLIATLHCVCMCVCVDDCRINNNNKMVILCIS